ncbi:hypothetical protein OG765_20670 [Streptomyces sp. NBC_00555]|uniref:hypothetical protein n=1 Tax=Streptomyces sp. NBC_00555 TaxID=2903662 RepID=UPI002253C88F|nr:hypothetical protein [Streptomyces sp. NBC_00555]MCX5013386.1 hypothetical protein [Streptomyces sp. NBC_00555]
MTGQWESLPAGIRAQADGYVLQDRRFQAVRAVWEGGRGHGIGLNEAQFLVHERYLLHGDRIARTPDCPLDLDSLAARTAGIRGRVLVIEAVWDGDTVHDWFVILLAITADPAAEHHLATVYHHMGGAAAAAGAGRSLATHLGVPFHFASPDSPDDEAPRWQP